MATRKANSRGPRTYNPLNKQEGQNTPATSFLPSWVWFGVLAIALVWVVVKWVIPAETGNKGSAYKIERASNKTDQASAKAPKAAKKSIVADLKASVTSLIVGKKDTATAQVQDFTKLPNFILPAFNPDQEQIVRHRTFTLSYNEGAEQANWVAYTLRKSDVEGTASRDDDHFKPDPLVRTESASPSDYKHSGYDRGHLVPAADRKASEADLAETFLMSNISPQLHGMNAGIWEHAESQVRDWATTLGKVYVATGPCLKPLPTRRIGIGSVAVPDYFYKIVLYASKGDYRMIGFYIPNQSSKKPLAEYVLSVDEIEKKTGLDFFPLLPDELERQLEKHSSLSDWP